MSGPWSNYRSYGLLPSGGLACSDSDAATRRVRNDIANESFLESKFLIGGDLDFLAYVTCWGYVNLGYHHHG